MDEVGRGAFAGPLLAGCVIFSSQLSVTNKTPIINDSKKLTPRQREVADNWIKKNALAWGVGSASVSYINKWGITKATSFAFRSALRAVKESKNLRIQFLLVDAFYVPYVRGVRKNKQMPLTRGDTLSFSISSASIIAKVARDKMMSELSRKANYRKYFWFSNKGYGTKGHREAIINFGATRHHRKDFLRKLLS